MSRTPVDPPVFVSEKEISEGILIDHNGKVLFNLWQQDIIALVKRTEDGFVHIYNKRTGKLMIPPYHPDDEIYAPKCRHCGRYPFGE